MNEKRLRFKGWETLVNNKKRGQDGFGHGNTYQTYIWLETKKDIKQKNDFYLEMLQKRMEAIHR